WAGARFPGRRRVAGREGAMRDNDLAIKPDIPSAPLAEPASDTEAGPLKPGMEVCDLDGKTIGTIAHIHQPPFPADEPDAWREALVEVKTGILGLGSHYYIPRSAFQETLRDSAFLSKTSEQLATLGWDRKPPFLE